MRKLKKQIKAVAITASLAVCTQLSAANLSDKNIYAGFQSSWPSHGLSVKMDFTDKITGQAVVGFLGDLHNYSVRGLYKFTKERFYNMYGYGSIGLWTWDSDYVGWEDESVVGIGGGAGIEYDLRGLDSSFIPLFVNAELGLNIASFDHYDFSSIGIGVGLHYKF
ncbi:MAG: hypothetical protein DSZ05_07215 [Sulfurospirillum sp.]|nr:MAG: hypothetical protein DSZ05_07215 [Sulfurospirillum sp.]